MGQGFFGFFLEAGERVLVRVGRSCRLRRVEFVVRRDARRKGVGAETMRVCGLADAHLVDFELEGFGGFVGDHESDLCDGFAGKVRLIEAVAAEVWRHGRERNLDGLPVAGGLEFGLVVVARAWGRFGEKEVAFAIAPEADHKT